MTHADHSIGFRVVGGVHELRQRVKAPAAFVAHCAADPSSTPERECYLSVFQFSDYLRGL